MRRKPLALKGQTQFVTAVTNSRNALCHRYLHHGLAAIDRSIRAQSQPITGCYRTPSVRCGRMFGPGVAQYRPRRTDGRKSSGAKVGMLRSPVFALPLRILTFVRRVAASTETLNGTRVRVTDRPFVTGEAWLLFMGAAVSGSKCVLPVQIRRHPDGHVCTYHMARLRNTPQRSAGDVAQSGLGSNE